MTKKRQTTKKPTPVFWVYETKTAGDASAKRKGFTAYQVAIDAAGQHDSGTYANPIGPILRDRDRCQDLCDHLNDALAAVTRANENDRRLLESHGWVVECDSPLRISNGDGSVATGVAAEMVLELLEVHEDE